VDPFPEGVSPLPPPLSFHAPPAQGFIPEWSFLFFFSARLTLSHQFPPPLVPQIFVHFFLFAWKIQRVPSVHKVRVYNLSGVRSFFVPHFPDGSKTVLREIKLLNLVSLSHITPRWCGSPSVRRRVLPPMDLSVHRSSVFTLPKISYLFFFCDLGGRGARESTSLTEVLLILSFLEFPLFFPPSSRAEIWLLWWVTFPFFFIRKIESPLEHRSNHFFSLLCPS